MELEELQQQWRDLDFSDAPLDLRDANLPSLRAYNCKFGSTLCSGESNWGQTVLRDCDVGKIQWNGADRGGHSDRQ